jgi:hypothetical protein
MQRQLSEQQIQSFHHDVFVEDQVNDFVSLVGRARGVVADVGGGCGFFAIRLRQLNGQPTRVHDLDQASLTECEKAGVESVLSNALEPAIKGDEAAASFNLVLHHLVGASEKATRELQQRALAAWRGQVSLVFVNEYIYESFIRGLSGWLIFSVTRSGPLSAIARLIAAIVPSLHANTLGTGVRFRSHDEWKRLFHEAGYDVERVTIGANEPVSLARRLLLIKAIRRDSFLLVPSGSQSRPGTVNRSERD